MAGSLGENCPLACSGVTVGAEAAKMEHLYQRARQDRNCHRSCDCCDFVGWEGAVPDTSTDGPIVSRFGVLVSIPWLVLQPPSWK